MTSSMWLASQASLLAAATIATTEFVLPPAVEGGDEVDEERELEEVRSRARWSIMMMLVLLKMLTRTPIFNSGVSVEVANKNAHF
jgi:hypothetical protein